MAHRLAVILSHLVLLVFPTYRQDIKLHQLSFLLQQPVAQLPLRLPLAQIPMTPLLHKRPIHLGEWPTAGGKADYPFPVPTAGTSIVGAIVNAPDLASNSLYVNIDAEPIGRTMIWDIPLISGYQFRAVSWRGNGTAVADQFVPQVFTLAAGTHTLIFRGREANTRFSQVSVQVGKCSDLT